MPIDKIDEGIFRIKIPFEELYTTVYLVTGNEGTVIVDSATYPSDADNYIIPALAELGVALEEIKYIALTHSHGDHTGGAVRLSELVPGAQTRAYEPLNLPRFSLLSDGELLCGRLRAVHLPGHTKTSVGYLDTKTNTLLSGDCLQLAGVGKYTNGVAYPELYKDTVKRLKEMNISRIVAAHEYVPLGSIAEGEDAVLRYLDTCLDLIDL